MIRMTLCVASHSGRPEPGRRPLRRAASNNSSVCLRPGVQVPSSLVLLRFTLSRLRPILLTERFGLVASNRSCTLATNGPVAGGSRRYARIGKGCALGLGATFGCACGAALARGTAPTATTGAYIYTKARMLRISAGARAAIPHSADYDVRRLRSAARLSYRQSASSKYIMRWKQANVRGANKSNNANNAMNPGGHALRWRRLPRGIALILFRASGKRA